ncbi:hypothetical protein [Adlercreutzia murintestinalis]|uniref:hypothetical protein n=1 Tax=Adlercreutzia murintestinalis TaxID=2941325 RepID=UPI00203BC474|nr:hypothetical protein [Adlercreutzia murintestinalis]
MSTARSRRAALVAFCVVACALYVYGVASTGCIPRAVEGIALPLDFMVGIPAGFYLMVVRPRRLTSLCVIPVIWIGYGLSVFALGSPEVGALPWLLCVLVPVEVAIAARECLKVAHIYRVAKAKGPDPMVWFTETMRYLVRHDTAAHLAAAELSVWHYALLSWRRAPYVLSGEKAFSYHNAGGYLNMMLGLALAFPVEIVGVHLLVAQWSVAAACAITALSVYAVVWLAGDARARVMRPVAIGGDCMRLECGIQMEARIPLAAVREVTFTEPTGDGLAKGDKLNFGTFYQANIWIAVKQPIAVRTMLGEKRARVIGLSLDDPQGFAKALAAANH